MFKNAYAILYCSIFALGALLYGYDGTYFTGVEAMTKFKEDYGNTVVDGKPAFTDSILSIVTSLVQVGELVGALAASFIGNTTGRRGTFMAACLFISLGTVIQLAVSNIGGIAAGRVVLGMGVGIIANCVPLYLSEVPPKEIRGAMTGSWQLTLAIGQVVGACVAQGTKDMKNTGAYRIPMGLQLAIPVFVFSVIYFVPESPRYLIANDKQEAARAALMKIHKEDKEYEPTRDLMEMTSSVQQEQSMGGGGWLELVTNPVEARKMMCTIGMLFGQQITGVQFIFSYATVFVENIGMSDAFLITIIIDIIEVVGVVVALPLVDRFGRRVLLLPTTLLMAASLFIIGCLDIKQPRNEAANTGIVAMIMVFVFFFNLAAGPLAWTVATETCIGRNRNRIMTLGTASFFIGAWAVAFSLPYLYTAIGPKLGFMYAGLCMVYFFFMYFCVGETKGRTLEELTEIFEMRLPAKEWKTYTSSEQQRNEKGMHPTVSHQEVA